MFLRECELNLNSQKTPAMASPAYNGWGNPISTPRESKDSVCQEQTKLPSAAALSALYEQRNQMLLVFDFESTGLGRDAQGIEVAYLISTPDGNIVEQYAGLLFCGKKSSAGALSVHKIPDARVEQYGNRDVSDILRRLIDRMQEVVDRGGHVIAHNAKFDLRILRQTCEVHGVFVPPGLQMTCMLRLARTVKDGRLCKVKTNSSLFAFLGGDSSTVVAHSAMGDCTMTLHNYLKCTSPDLAFWPRFMTRARYLQLIDIADLPY